MNNSHVRACAGGDVRELEGNVAAANKNDSVRQLIQLAKFIALCDLLLTINIQSSRTGSRSNMHEAAGQNIFAYLQFCAIDKARAAMESSDSGFSESFIPGFGHGICEGSFEMHQRRPVYARVRGCDAFVLPPSDA